ncbi:hypothetical protein [Neotamlana laminarinivorans]|uniref:Uncharacterized protein n=1 Tax=Neotamlana laminarinivorans TaxID=2883124 RepID=A0A9X1L4U3_9FLAO|nr:hypothetical protein [Tamlana laminarinivorans]MCB4799844.1 hypothetical protein [Tamlana laminarinivorans]
MNNKITFLSFCFFVLTFSAFAQKNGSESIISRNAIIKKYHNKKELNALPKGELLNLYSERVEALTHLIPYLAFASKPGIDMGNLGIPTSSANVKKFTQQRETTTEYLEDTKEFHKEILPYSDTNRLVAAVLFYEEVMKSIHNYEDFN